MYIYSKLYITPYVLYILYPRIIHNYLMFEELPPVSIKSRTLGNVMIPGWNIVGRYQLDFTTIRLGV